MDPCLMGAFEGNVQAFTWVMAMEHVPGEDFTIDRPAEYAFWRDYKPRGGNQKLLDAGGRVLAPFNQQGERARLIGRQLHIHILPQTAPLTTRAAAVGRQFLAPDPQRRQRLDDLHGAADHIGGKARRR